MKDFYWKPIRNWPPEAAGAARARFVKKRIGIIQRLTPFRRPLVRSLKIFCGRHEWLLEFSGGGLWGSRGRLGAFWEHLGVPWGLLGDLRVFLIFQGAVLGRGWRRLGALLGPLGAILRWLIKTIIDYFMVTSCMVVRGNCRAEPRAHTRFRESIVFIIYRANPGSAWSHGDS